MLYDHPSIAALAKALANLQFEDADSEGEDLLEEGALPTFPSSEEADFMGRFVELLRRVPHAICIEEGSFSATYCHVFHKALAFQRMLRRRSSGSVAVSQPLVAVCFRSVVDLVAGMLATLFEGFACCVLEFTSPGDIIDRLRAVQPLAVLGNGADMFRPVVEHLATQAQGPVWVDVREATRQMLQLTRPLKPRSASPGFVHLATESNLKELEADCLALSGLRSSMSAWRQQLPLEVGTRFLSTLPVGDASGLVALWSSLSAGATFVTSNPFQPSQAVSPLALSISDKRPAILACTARELAVTCPVKLVMRSR